MSWLCQGEGGPSPAHRSEGEEFETHEARGSQVHDHPLKPDKIPYALRVRGSVIRRVWPQVVLIAAFSTTITCLEVFHGQHLGIPSTMISTLGFVTGLALSFRTQTAYANWKEGRIAWEKLTSVSRNLARIIWVHGREDNGTEDILMKKTAINLVAAFGVALKHHLREERGNLARDVRQLIRHLNTWSGLSMDSVQESLSGAQLAARHLLYEPHSRDTTANYCAAYGTLPVEIVHSLAAYADLQRSEKGLDPQSFTNVSLQLNQLMDVLSTCERILQTPVPVAYNIVIAQLVWLFMLFLPFQLQPTLGWVSIPATILTGIMLFGLAEIGLEIENPWGDDANDLDIDRYAQHIAIELDTITAVPRATCASWLRSSRNTPLYPYSLLSCKEMQSLPTHEMQEMLKQKAIRTSRMATDPLKSRPLYGILKRQPGGRRRTVSIHSAINVLTRAGLRHPATDNSEKTAVSEGAQKSQKVTLNTAEEMV